MEKNPKNDVEKVFRYIEANFSHPISASRLAEQAGYSRTWFSRLYHSITGKTIQSHLLELRLAKARELLGNTNMEIGEIALDVGFSGYPQFANMFKKKEGLSALEYRRATADPARATSGRTSKSIATQKVCDPFKGAAMGPWWTVHSGEWHQEDGRMTGRSASSGMLVYNRPLPENYRASFEFSFLDEPGGPFSDISMILMDSNLNQYCQFAIGSYSNSANVFRRFGEAWQWNLQARARPNNKWQTLLVEVDNENVRLWLDKECVFHFRDPFPPTYVARSRLGIACWRSAICMRNFVIEDKGYPAFIPAVRQGDSFFREGFYAEALHFYQRQSGSQALGSNEMELRFKAGMCQMYLHRNQEAAALFNSVVTLPEHDFWSQQARLGLLEMEFRDHNKKAFLQRLRRMSHIPAIRDSLRNLAIRAARQYASQGFMTHRLKVNQVLLESEDPESPPGIMAHIRAGRGLLSLRQHAQAETMFRKAGLRNSPLPESSVSALHELVYMLIASGKRKESREVMEEIRERSQSAADLARCDIHEALNLRGQGSLTEALRVLETVSEKHRSLRTMAAMALLQQSQIHCILGDVARAGKVLEICSKEYPGIPERQPGQRVSFWAVPPIAAGDFRNGAELYAEDLTVKRNQPAMQAFHGISSGILFCLAGMEARAREIWQQVMDAFPQATCNGYAAMARHLMAGEQESFEKVYHPAHVRAGLLYLMGLLKEKQGLTDQARECFHKSASEDGTGGWGASFSRRKLAD